MSSAALLAALSLSSAASAFDFGLHVLPANPSRACMSYDGQVVGISRTLYTQAGASEIVRPDYAGFPRVRCLNDDGSVFGGTFQGGGSGDVGTFDRGPGDYTQVGQSFQGQYISIDAISGDGSIGIVNRTDNIGLSSSGLVRGDGNAVLDPTPTQFISMLGTDLSRNGQFAVGNAQLMDGGSVAYRHHAGVGYAVISFPGEITTSAACISADGTIVAGSRNSEPFLWTDGVFSEINYDRSLYSSCAIREMNDNATVLVGELVLAGTPLQPSVGAIGFGDQGWVVAQDHFASLGILMPQGRTIRSLTAVSFNGQTFLGRFDNDQYFVVTVPAPGSLALLYFGVCAARRRR